jgi:hypothetical protein
VNTTRLVSRSTMGRFLPSLLAVTQIAVVSCWTWPNAQLEQLDMLRFDQTGVNQHSFGGFSASCTKFSFAPNQGNRTNVGDWLRTVRPSFFTRPREPQSTSTQAYHDMATHNIADGSGGLDGSIAFAAEQGRPEVSLSKVR